MHVCRPFLFVQVARIAVRIESDTGDVVGERVEPDVNDVAFVESYGNTPRERGSRHAKVLKSGFQKVVDHLVFAGYGNDEIGMFVVVFQKAVGVFAHLEEIRFFFRHLDFAAAVGAFAVNELAFRPERFAWRAVPALVRAFVDVALFIKFFEYLLHLLFVLFVGGADKFVVGGVHQIPYALDICGSLVHKFLGSHSRRLRFEFDFFTVLVRARLKKHVETFHTLCSCNEVGKHDFVGVSDVRFPRSVGDCRGHIKFLFVLHIHLVGRLMMPAFWIDLYIIHLLFIKVNHKCICARGKKYNIV